jgi:hypothetical protein
MAWRASFLNEKIRMADFRVPAFNGLRHDLIASPAAFL